MTDAELRADRAERALRDLLSAFRLALRLIAALDARSDTPGLSDDTLLDGERLALTIEQTFEANA